MLFQNGNFVLTVTRLAPEREQIKRVKAKLKSAVPTSNLSIYMFNNFDNYLEFCNFLNNNSNEDIYLKLKKSSLYLYNSKYYLCINISNKNLSTYKPIHYAITEFASYINNSELFERKLIEYGKIIFKTNAISNCIKHFGNV